jgi:hypothetical protein
MSSFVNPEYSNEHPGVLRIESAIEGARHLRQRWSATGSLATLLLAAMSAAVLTVAYQVMDSVDEGHLLVLWMALWAACFAGLALFSGAARKALSSTKAALDSWAQHQAQARADVRLWQMARRDSRVMSDLQSAISHNELDAPVADSAAVPLTVTAPLTLRHRSYCRNHV